MRDRVKRSLMATLILSQGVRMLLGGDEIGRTQQGNNNAYCQDNEISLDRLGARAEDRGCSSSPARLPGDLPRRTRSCAAGVLHRPAGGPRRGKDLAWIRPDGEEMTRRGLGRPATSTRARHADRRQGHRRGRRARAARSTATRLLLLLNGGTRTRYFDLPQLDRASRWVVLLDTVRDATRTIRRPGLNLSSHSLMLLRAERGDGGPR